MNTFKAPHSPVRSRVVDTIYKNTKSVWSRQDAVSSCNERRALQEMVAVQREKIIKTIQKTANVRRVKGGYRIIGWGILNIDKLTLLKFLKEKQYKRMRIGGLVFNV